MLCEVQCPCCLAFHLVPSGFCGSLGCEGVPSSVMFLVWLCREILFFSIVSLHLLRNLGDHNSPEFCLSFLLPLLAELDSFFFVGSGLLINTEYQCHSHRIDLPSLCICADIASLEHFVNFV